MLSILKQPNKTSQKKIVTFFEKPPQIRRITRLPTVIDLDFYLPEKKLNSDIPLPKIFLLKKENTAIKESALPRKNAVSGLFGLSCDECFETWEYDNLKKNLEKLLRASKKSEKSNSAKVEGRHNIYVRSVNKYLDQAHIRNMAVSARLKSI